MPKKTSDHDDQAKTTNRHGPILEVWQYTQMEKRIESAENGITRVDIILMKLNLYLLFFFSLLHYFKIFYRI